MSVPKAMQPKYDEISKLIIDYSDEYLDDEYKELCLHALEKLCRKRPSPVTRGRAATWAAGIVYAVGSNNFIFDKSQPIHYTGSEIAEPFGVATSTASNKANEIKKMLKINLTNAEWSLPSMAEKNPMLWSVMVNGLLLDARYLPLELQIACHEKGLIPYVPALKAEGESEEQGGTEE